MSINWRKKLILAKIETTYGTDAAPVAVNAIEAQDVQLSPMEGSDITRDLIQPHFGARGSIPTELHSTLSFKVELSGSGTAGTVPGWDVLMRACGCAATVSAGTSVVYNPVTNGHQSITLHFFIDDQRYVLKGARGNVKIALTKSQIPMLEFAFTGLFSVPATASQVAPNYTNFAKPLVANLVNTPTFTIDGGAFNMRSFALDLQNQVEHRSLVGHEEIIITDRNDMAETTVEAKSVDTFNPFTKAQEQASMAIELTHGTVTGNVAALSIPKAQLQRLSSLASEQNIKEWPLSFQVLPTLVTTNGP